jgi:hypothetical protein|tara:strand:- start:603 stop:770 length:168 start_codon:yes stop_codon:yes gene_type:complete
MKDMSPFQCGQEDALFNRKIKPRKIEEGKEIRVTDKELIEQYINGFIDSKEFYGS